MPQISVAEGALNSPSGSDPCQRDESPRAESRERGNTCGEGKYLLQLCGNVWKLRYNGAEGLFPHHDRSGFLYIRELIRAPGKPLYCVDLAGVVTVGNRGASKSVGSPVLERDARLALRQRYSDLEDELKVAERNHDEGRETAAREEMHVLTAELCSSYCLGGRDRRMNSDVQRAAKRVSTAVRRAVKGLEARLPKLALHLTNSLQLGSFMVYRPDKDIPWIC